MVRPEEPAVPRRPVAGTVAVLVAVSMWGSMAVVTRVVDRVNGLVLGFHRLWIGCAATLVIFYATGRRLSLRSLRLSLTGGIAFGTDIVLFFTALRHTTVANATIVGALQPALVLVIAGPMFGEPVTASIVTLSAVAIGGVAIVVYGSSGTPVWSLGGDLLAFAALIAWTVYFVASRRVRLQLSPFEYLSAMLVVATVVLAPIALLSGARLDPGGVDAWAWIALLAIGSGGVGHLLVNWAHSHIDLSVMSLLTLAIPVFAVASAAIFQDEPISWVQVGGMAVVLGALAVVALQSARTAAVIAEAPAIELAD
jgi:drug/metabolite transporter (DMT)-like permease